MRSLDVLLHLHLPNACAWNGMRFAEGLKGGAHKAQPQNACWQPHVLCQNTLGSAASRKRPQGAPGPSRDPPRKKNKTTRKTKERNSPIPLWGHRQKVLAPAASASASLFSHDDESHTKPMPKEKKTRQTALQKDSACHLVLNALRAALSQSARRRRGLEESRASTVPFRLLIACWAFLFSCLSSLLCKQLHSAMTPGSPRQCHTSTPAAASCCAPGNAGRPSIEIHPKGHTEQCGCGSIRW